MIAPYSTIAELQRRFQPFLEKGDDSLIPPDLQRELYSYAVAVMDADITYNTLPFSRLDLHHCKPSASVSPIPIKLTCRWIGCSSWW